MRSASQGTQELLPTLGLFSHSAHFIIGHCPQTSALVLITVCGNLLIIISVPHFKKLHTPTNMLVLSLAVSDFLVGIFLMPPMFIWTIESCWIFGRVLCTIYWQITVVVNTVASLYFSGNFKKLVMCPGECFLSLSEVWTVIDLIYSFIFPLSVIMILYTQVFMIAKKHATAIRELNNHTRTKTQKITSHSMKSERKAAKVLGILVSVFIMCLLPYFIYSLLVRVTELQKEPFKEVLIVFYLNSTMNPVIYALFYPWFRRCIKLIITLQIFQTDSALINVLL
ncbi:trace amine-associated receptor 13c-like [Clarias gariepinus]